MHYTLGTTTTKVMVQKNQILGVAFC